MSYKALFGIKNIHLNNNYILRQRSRNAKNIKVFFLTIMVYLDKQHYFKNTYANEFVIASLLTSKHSRRGPVIYGKSTIAPLAIKHSLVVMFKL